MYYYTIVFSIFLLYVIYILYTSRRICPISNFKNKKCKSTYYTLVSKYGTPSVIFNERGGFCIWFVNRKIRGYPVYTIMLKDSEKCKTYITLITTTNVDFSAFKKMYHDSENRELTVSSVDIDSCIDTLKKYNIDRDVFVTAAEDDKGRELSINEKFTNTGKKIPLQP